MWINSENNIVLEDSEYVSPEGTRYPRNFPRSEIPGLVEVPDDAGEILRKQADSKRINNYNLEIQLRAIDEKKIRALTEAYMTGSSSRLQELEAEAVVLRAQWQH